MTFSNKYYCRFCAEIKESDELLNFENDPLKSYEVLERLSCFNVKNFNILADTVLPKTVCYSCDDSLLKAFDFFKKIEKAHSILETVSNLKDSELNDIDYHNKSEQSDVDYNKSELNDVDFNNDSLPENNSISEKETDTVKQEVENDLDYDVFVDLKIKEESESIDKDDPSCTTLHDDISKLSWNSYVWYCQYCSNEFPSITELRDHSKTLHNKCAAFKCADCKMMVAEYSIFIRHVGSHRQALRQRCSYCDEVLLLGLKRSHVKEHIKKPEVACTFCGEIFSNNALLHKHKLEYVKIKAKIPRRKKNTPVPENNLICRVCNKKFASMSVRNDHEKRHAERKREYTCDRCGKAYYTKGTLVTHLKVHDQNKPHVCKICNKRFLFPNMLRKHVETHTDIKKFSCDECGRSFRRSYQLKSHKIVHTDKMPYMCQFCSKSFKFAQILKNHERLHTGSKPYCCTICTSDFANWSNYNKHMVRRHGVDTAKKKITPVGIFPRNPETGQLMEAVSGEIEEWKDKLLASKIVKGKKTLF